MPFLDSTYDLITSCYAFEHFKPDEKRILLNQCHRVLKPGGKIVMLFDCDNDNLLFRWLKKDASLYKKRIIEHDSHYGLQKPSENIKLIENAGFKILDYRAANKTFFQHLPVFGWMEPYGEISKLAAWASKIAFCIRRYRLPNLAYQAFVTVLDDIVEKFLPLDYGRILLVVAEKEKLDW
jgi:SAM-dependent methyltransferase